MDKSHDKPVPVKKIDVLIRLHNQILERLTFAQVDVDYFTKRKFEIKGKSAEAIEDRKVCEVKAKESKKAVAQDILLLNIVEQHMSAELTAMDERGELDE